MKVTVMAVAAAILLAAPAANLAAQRFDNMVRGDFFAGFRGDQARLEKGMASCEKALAADPKDAAAMVWHGAGLYFLSGTKFRAGDIQGGIDLQQRGLKEMDDAVALRPQDLQTLIPRGATLLASAPFLPDEEIARPLLRKAVGDYETARRIQAPTAGQMSTHARGELLGGLAVGYRLLGEREKADSYLKEIIAELPGTSYAERANAWLSNPGAVKKTDQFCIACHE